MSITFTAEMSPITGHMITCGCEQAVGPVFGNYADACAYLAPLVEDESLRTAIPGCDRPEACLQYRLSIYALEADPAPSVNVANGNAVDLFAALGLSSDDPDRASGNGELWQGGTLTAEDFLGRVLFALAITPADEGRFSYDDTREGGMTMIACGRRVGYVQAVLAELHELALFAVDRGRAAYWS